MKQLILAATLGLAACATEPVPRQEAVLHGQLPPIQREYRAMIVGWSRTYYATPRAIASPRISDPVPIRDGSGRLMYLICVSAQNLGRGGAPAGPELHAFGLGPNFFTAPQNRNGSTLVAQDCIDRPLTYRPFPELARG